MRLAMVWTVFVKEWRDLLSNRLLLGAVAFPALIFAAIPTGLVAFIEINKLDPTSARRDSAVDRRLPEITPRPRRRHSSS